MGHKERQETVQDISMGKADRNVLRKPYGTASSRSQAAMGTDVIGGAIECYVVN